MQIISGKFRGKRLEWLSNCVTRPTTARVKENIFNILTSNGASLDGKRILVLFAGSGQMGIECYSRGATDIYFNDTSEDARSLIKKNCAVVGLNPDVSSQEYMDYLESLKMRELTFDIVFLDPPFADLEAAPNAAKFLRENNMLCDDATIVAETENSSFIFEGFSVRMKKYGREYIYFLKNDYK